MTTKEFAKILQDKLTSEYGVDLSVASNQQIYRSLALICRQMMSENHKKFQSKAIGTGSCLSYTSDAADEADSVEFVGRRLVSNTRTTQQSLQIITSNI